jgi:Carboxypeptidase regulatory-like domain
MIRIRQFLLSTAVAAGMAAYLLAPLTVHAQGTTQPAAVAIDSDDIGGLVTGPNGPESGVWVIAETRDLPTRYSKSVVTDDQGRFVIPDLPRGKYKVWVRGYGLIDSSHMDAEPGQRLNLSRIIIQT